MSMLMQSQSNYKNYDFDYDREGYQTPLNIVPALKTILTEKGLDY
jgi:hypothetical protein